MSATLAARARNDATLSMPPRRISGGKRQPSVTSRLMRWLGRKPGRAVVVLLFTAVAAAITLNALLFQKVRHPAPMLSAPSTSPPPARTTERRADVPAAQPQPQSQPAVPQGIPTQQEFLPPVRPGSLPQAQREAAPRPPAAVAPAPRAAQSAPATRPAPSRDPIADLINGGDLRPPADIRGAATARSGAAPR
ncbi:hypothetical protein [Bosea sp. WAO]|uniref:hypothetical protein n=1 Tax=Bosea sp. WAO TaxID=406341 RepID=UPI00083101D6|nr:hypothetical protein [Bosea sp. WAO]